MENVIDGFLKALAESGVNLDKSAITVDDLGCPHSPKALPARKMAIYSFHKNGQYLKIGKAGLRSNARFQSHHYSPSRAKSTLAYSVLNDNSMAKHNLNETTVAEWIRQNIHRVDIILDQGVDIFVLNFLEAFLHCKYKPKYEGFIKQR